MPVSREGYKQYLNSMRKKDGSQHFSDGSIDSYCSRLNSASEALGIDIWALTDTNQIRQLIIDCSPQGKHAAIGASGNQTAYNALKQWADYVASNERAHQVYSLLWAPERVLHGDFQGGSELTVGAEFALTCDHKQPVVGDTVYLMRYEPTPKGFVAKAVVTRSSFDAPYWKDQTKTWRYIGIRVLEVRQTVTAGLLPKILIERICDRHKPEFKPSLLKSGVQVPTAVANELDRVWSNSQDVHSLRQFIEWAQQDEVNSRPEWLPRFKERLVEIQLLKQSTTPISDDMVEWLWAPAYNGICSVMPGVLPRVDFERQKGFLRDVAESIRNAPSAETHRSIFKTWETAVSQGLFEKTYQVVINRVFAAFAAEQYTTIVNPANCKKILKCLQQEFSMDVQLPDDWPTQNAWILSSLQEAGVDMNKVAENNVAIWQLYEALAARSNENKVMVAITEEEEDKSMPNADLAPLNQIYYGPPGTGKTYITMEAAVRAAEPGSSWKDREELKAKYRVLTDAGRIVFVTFHQSYSYEDFVEGLTASSDSGQIQYAPKNGVFKKLVQKAKDNQTSGVKKTSDSFDTCWELFLQQLSVNSDGVKVSTRRSAFVVTEVDDNTIRFDKNSGDSVHSLSVSTLQAVFNKQRVIKGGLQPYYESLINHLKALGEQQALTSVERQNFVLVIDEINRGNISRIFGELITLIEPSKRLGGKEPLEVILPLTGDKFSVPDNLYIIGTMNTADRSLAGLDLALRRRFDFIEMPPQLELLANIFVEEIDLELMLKTINERISVLLDKDHCIGHASFIHLHPDHRPANAPDVVSLAELAQVFQHKVLPLLQEYFFEDWQRIAWVLNDQNKVADIAFMRKASGKTMAELFKGVPQIKARERWEINQNAFNNAHSYRLIYQNEAITP